MAVVTLGLTREQAEELWDLLDNARYDAQESMGDEPEGSESYQMFKDDYETARDLCNLVHMALEDATDVMES